jgi:hypothetical protein
LDLVTDQRDIECDGCGRAMMHDWTTVAVVQNIIKKRMRQAYEAKIQRTA